MPNDIFLPVETTVTQTEEVGMTLKELSLLKADATSAGAITVVLAALNDDTGEWRADVGPVVVQKIDDLESENPAERYAASALQQLMFTAIVADNPTNQALGVVGMTVWDAAKAILGNELGVGT